MKYKIYDYDGEEWFLWGSFKNKNDVITALLQRIGDLQYEVEE